MEKKKLRLYYIIAIIAIVLGFIMFSHAFHSDGNSSDKMWFDGKMQEIKTYPAHDDISLKWYGIKLYTDESGWQHDYFYGDDTWKREKKVHVVGIIVTAIIIVFILFFPKLYISRIKERVDNVKKKTKISKEKKKKSNIASELKEYKLLLDEGMITEEDYRKKKDELLGINSYKVQQSSTEEELLDKNTNEPKDNYSS